MNGTTTIFVTDADNREVLEYDGSSGAIQRWYAYGLGANAVLNQTNVSAATRTALIPDIQGSIIATLDSGAGVLTKAGYLPYGKSANAPASFGYSAQRIDPETNGLYYYRTRHYSPVLGRFLQSDPIGAKGGINLYAYAKNDPLNLVDITGRAPDAANGGISSFSSGPSGVSEEEDEEEEATGPGLNFSQTTAGPYFQSSGIFAGQSIADVAGQLRSGSLDVSDVPVRTITLDEGNPLIVDTRSSLALMQANIPQSSWNVIDLTGNAQAEADMAERLAYNGLTTSGTDVLRITGLGASASVLIPQP